MSWKGGFDRSFSAAQIKEYVQSVKLGWKPKGIVLHNTSAPTLAQWKATPGGEAQRLRNLAHYYKNQKKWSSGPHFFIGEWIWQGTPLTSPGTHSPSYNGTHIGVEVAGEYATDIFEGEIKTNTIATLAALCEGLGFDPDKQIILHKEDPKTTHKGCPGKNLNKAAIIAAVKAKMSKPAALPVAVASLDDYVVQPGDTLWGLSKKFGKSVADLVAVNGGSAVIHAGRKLSASLKGGATKTSRKGRVFIAREEAVALEVYMDGKTPAAGMGHNDASLVPGTKITLQQAMDWHEKDMAWNDRVILLRVKVPLTQEQFDACSSFLHAIGSGNFTSSRAVRLLNEGKYDEAAEAFKLWHKANGKDNVLLPRRERETAIFKRGDYGDLSKVPVWTGNPRTTKPVWQAMPA